jgi:hypothetical protein
VHGGGDHYGGIVARTTCDGNASDLAIALCSGAPCFDDATAAGPLNVTCLCLVYPYGYTRRTISSARPLLLCG